MTYQRYASGISGLFSQILFLLAVPTLLHAQTPVSFTHTTVDASGPLDPWGKAAGDINGDGKIDIIVGGYTSGGLVWYENPGWVKHSVSGRAGFRTDHEVRDIDRDGRNDIVSLGADANGSPVVEWFKNPGTSGTWAATVISQQTLHDVEVADLDGDGDLDCVARDQEVFGSGHGDIIYVYIQKTPSSWTPVTFSCSNGEGLKVADINRDGKPDIIISGTWFENLGNGTTWQAHSYTTNYTHRSVTVDVADINGDGRADIVLAPAETIGGSYRISWFEAPAAPSQAGWTEHIIENNVETDHHFVGTGDFNNDGLMDVASAAQHTGSAPQQVEVLLNGGGGLTWKKIVLATTGSHNMRIADFDNDGDLDLFGANWEGRQVDLWTNKLIVTGTRADPLAPGEFRKPRLDQNYPNPFNPETVISYQISEASIVKLGVYDLLGRQVAVLVDDWRLPGRYSTTFDGSALASGVYIYRVEAGRFLAARRLILLK